MIQPKPGEVWWIDLGMRSKFRPLMGLVFPAAVVNSTVNNCTLIAEICFCNLGP